MSDSHRSHLSSLTMRLKDKLHSPKVKSPAERIKRTQSQRPVSACIQPDVSSTQTHSKAPCVLADQERSVLSALRYFKTLLDKLVVLDRRRGPAGDQQGGGGSAVDQRAVPDPQRGGGGGGCCVDQQVLVELLCGAAGQVLEAVQNLVQAERRIQKRGLGAYDKAVVKDDSGEIIASRFMAYHTPLTNSQEFTAALQKARELAHNITMGMRAIPGTSPDFEVFPYTVTYVFYEQYLLPTFVVCCLLLGMDLRSGLLNLLTIIMITVDTVGVMTLWGIDYNAVALINLVTCVGISVEFVSHMTRSFALSIQPTQVERAKEATANMGSAVLV